MHHLSFRVLLFVGYIPRNMHIPSNKIEKPFLTISLKDIFLFHPSLPDGWHMGQIHPPASSVSCNKTQFQPLLRHLLAVCISKMVSIRRKNQPSISVLKLDMYKKSHECDVLVNCIPKNCNDIQWSVLRIFFYLPIHYLNISNGWMSFKSATVMCLLDL